MGYSTEFSGKMTISPALNADQVAYIEALGTTRRMKRNVSQMAGMSDPLREAVGLPLGTDGEFFVGNRENSGQNSDKSVVDSNQEPSTQPGLWFQWQASEDGKYLQWDGGEKFYEYIEWMKYLQNSILSKWGVVLNGHITWKGEDSSDKGFIFADNGKITSYDGNDYRAKLTEMKQAKAAKESKKELNEAVDPFKNDLQVTPRSKL